MSALGLFATPTRLAWPVPFLRGRGGIGRRAALRSLWGNSRGSSSLLGRTRNIQTAPVGQAIALKTGRFADVAELVDALASGASGLTAVEVRVLSSAPKQDYISVFGAKNMLGQIFVQSDGPAAINSDGLSGRICTRIACQI